MSFTECKLTYDVVRRYKRQIVLNEIGVDGQIKISKAKVLIVGLGGLGSPVAIYLASAGVGTIGIVDFDNVEISNLHRQIIHNEKSIGHCKTKSAGEHLKMLNSTINIIEHQNINIDRDLFTPGNDCVFSSYDVIVDCTDNIDTRYLLSDVSRISKRILVCASVLKWEGQVFVFMLDGPCYRCLFPERKSNIITCNTAGVIGPACGIIGSIQALEVVKVILGITKKSKLVVYDGLEDKMKKFDLQPKTYPCMACKGEMPAAFEVIKCCESGTLPEKVYFIEWDEYLENENNYILIDLRPKILYEMVHLRNSINIPISELEQQVGTIKNSNKVYALLCAKGINAQKAAVIFNQNNIRSVVIRGGYEQYKKEKEHNFPL